MNAQSLGVLAMLLGVMILLAHRRDAGLHREASGAAWQQLRLIAVRLPLALMAASLLGALLPRETLASLLGPKAAGRESRWPVVWAPCSPAGRW